MIELKKNSCFLNFFNIINHSYKAGQERFQSLGVAFYRGADICILCMDLTNIHSFNNLNAWYNDFLKQASPSDSNTFPFVLVGNKIDLEENRLISSHIAIEWCQNKNNVTYFETSVKERINVDEAFKNGVKRAIHREKQRISMYDDIPYQIKISNCINGEIKDNSELLNTKKCNC